MKKTTIFLILLSILVANVQAQNIIENKNKSLFTGTWDWIENNVYKDCFYIIIGERNDSLLFSISGVFYAGYKIHGFDFDNNGDIIADVRTTIPKGIKAISKISEGCSNFYSDPNDSLKYNPVSFELLNDTTMLFILDDNKPYWPDTAIMKRRDYTNPKFSQKENNDLYKEK